MTIHVLRISIYLAPILATYIAKILYSFYIRIPYTVLKCYANYLCKNSHTQFTRTKVF